MAGISAAHFLRRKGYAITVFERETRLGGKCCSVEIDGLVHELGACVLPPGYTEMHKLLREFDLPTARYRTVGRFGLYDLATGRRREFGLREGVRLLWLLARYCWLWFRAGRWGRPGFAHIAPTLAEPFSTWLHRHGLEDLEDIFAAPLTGYGYGYASEISAAYALKYFAPIWTVPTILGSAMRMVPAGLQALVERMAVGLDVRLGAAVHRVEAGDTLTIVTDQGVERFDRVIFAAGAPPPGCFTAIDGELEQLSGQIRDYLFHVIAADVAALPGTTFFVPAHLQRDGGFGRLVCGYQRWPHQSPMTALMGLVDRGDSDADIDAVLCADAGRLGKSTGEIRARRRWDFFPHVSPEDFGAGFHRKLEAAQGRHGIYFAGEVMEFPMLERVVRYSQRLVEAHF
jgi:glycine/D-amino acid oxidase-like deaminating enzyme